MTLFWRILLCLAAAAESFLFIADGGADHAAAAAVCMLYLCLCEIAERKQVGAA